MANYLLAVLVPATATVENINRLLTRPMRRMVLQHGIDSYRLGGALTGVWDPDYDPEADPANWQPCPGCEGTGRRADGPCGPCADPRGTGRPPGTSLKFAWDWPPHPGDIVPLPTLLGPLWRFPPQRAPEAWVDLTGTVWLDDTGLAKYSTGAAPQPVPARLRDVLGDLQAGRRNPRGRRQRPEVFDPTAWSVAVVTAHH